MSEKYSRTFMSSWDMFRWDFREVIEGEHRLSLPDEDTIAASLAHIVSDFGIFGADEIGFIGQQAGRELTSVEVAAMLLALIPTMGLQYRPEDDRLLMESLLDSGLTRSEAFKTALDVRDVATQVGLTEAVVIYDTLIPDPVAGALGRDVLMQFIEAEQ